MNRTKENLIEALDHIDFLIVVPTSGMNEIYAHFEKTERCIYVTREEEGVAVCTGLTMAGKTVVLFIQQSGVGNLMNAVFTLAEPYNVKFPIVVLIRGENDPNPIHWMSSKYTCDILTNFEPHWIDWGDEASKSLFEKISTEGGRWILSNY